MRAICLYLHIHQPVRYREYSIFDVSNTDNYFNDHYDGRQSNERIFRKVAAKSYHPMLDLLERNMLKHPDFNTIDKIIYMDFMRIKCIKICRFQSYWI